MYQALNIELKKLEHLDLDLDTFKELCNSLSALPFIRRIYLLENRKDARPSVHPIDLALEVPEATEKQWKNVLDVVKEARFQLTRPPIRMDSLDANQRTRIIKAGHKIYDRSASPVSPT